MAIRTPILGQLYTRAIIPALGMLGLDSPVARNLVLGTAAQETGGRYLVQVPDGPALSFFQIEPATARDVLREVASLSPARYAVLETLQIPGLDPVAQLDCNLVYAAALCRLRYWIVPDALPTQADGVYGLAGYWKKFYNTDSGSGTPAEFVGNFATLIGALPA
jgi:hypothetical protein